MRYSIGQVGKMLDVSSPSLRLWERLELIPKAKRRSLGQREYDDADIERIRNFLADRMKKGKK